MGITCDFSPLTTQAPMHHISMDIGQFLNEITRSHVREEPGIGTA